MVAYVFNLSTWEATAGRSLEVKASLDYTTGLCLKKQDSFQTGRQDLGFMAQQLSECHGAESKNFRQRECAL